MVLFMTEYMCFAVVNTSGSIMEQRTPSEHKGNESHGLQKRLGIIFWDRI